MRRVLFLAWWTAVLAAGIWVQADRLHVEVVVAGADTASPSGRPRVTFENLSLDGSEPLGPALIGAGFVGVLAIIIGGHRHRWKRYAATVFVAIFVLAVFAGALYPEIAAPRGDGEYRMETHPLGAGQPGLARFGWALLVTLTVGVGVAAVDRWADEGNRR